MGLASRKLGVPCAGRRTGSSTSPRARTRPGGRPSSRPRSPPTASCSACATTSLEDVGAYVRAPEPATLYRMHGSLSGAYRVRNVAARNRVVLTNRCPSGLNRGFGGPQLYFALERTMAIAARAARPRPGRARAAQPRAASSRTRRRAAALYDSGDYEACLDDALELVALRRAPRASRRARAAADRHRHRVRRRAVGLEHGLHHARADARRARGGRCPKSGNAEGCIDRDQPARRDHRPAVDDAAGPGPPRRSRADRRRRARGRARRTSRCSPRWTPSTNAWTVPPGKYSSRFSGVGAGAVAAAARQAARRRSRRSASTRATRRLAAARRRDLPLEPGVAARGHGARAARRPPSTPRRISSRRTRRTASPRRPRTASSSTSRSSRSTRTRERCASSTT